MAARAVELKPEMFRKSAWLVTKKALPPPLMTVCDAVVEDAAVTVPWMFTVSVPPPVEIVVLAPTLPVIVITSDMEPPVIEAFCDVPLLALLPLPPVPMSEPFSVRLL